MPIRVNIGDNPFFAHKRRKDIILWLIYLIGILFSAKLAWLQLVQHSKYQKISQTQSVKLVKVEPVRGNIYDKSGKRIVFSEPSFSLSLIKKEFEKCPMPLFTELSGIGSGAVGKQFEKYKRNSSRKPIKMFRDIDPKYIYGLEEYNRYLPGVSVGIDSKRSYNKQSNMTHLLGYIGEISQKQIDKKKYYSPGDAIGKNGIESSYEDFLKGSFGLEYVRVNKYGQKVSSYDKGSLDKIARRGFDLHLNIIDSLQSRAEELMIGKTGAVVVISPKTGGILTLVSAPDYDLSDFSGRIPTKVYNKVRNNPKKPLQHRAINSAYPPGSSWKMLVALAGLEEGIIGRNTTFLCEGGYQLGNKFFRCSHVDGYISVENAIRSSCNTFFYRLGMKLGLEKMISYGNLFGFGSRTGVDLPYESRGNYRSFESISKSYKGKIPKWKELNYGIGQGEILVTPLQMARYTATIANSGTLFQPRIVEKIFNNAFGRFQMVSNGKRKLNISDKNFDVVRRGMWKVVNMEHGTAQNVWLPGLNICGKTSTAQNPHGEPHAWFVSFAPMDEPEIVIVVLVENGGTGAYAAAPITRELYKYYFNIQTPKPAQDVQQADSIAVLTAGI
jgi:penicillin-binding protein 2